MKADPTNSSPRKQLEEIVQSVEEYTNYLVESGERTLLVSKEATTPPTVATTTPIAKDDSIVTASTPQANATASLEDIAREISACNKCPLCEARTKTVPGQGHARPEIAFVGEGPGADEDRQGLAFVGRAGQLLTKIIEAMGLSRDEVWIGNIVKCRPPGNRAPMPDEMEACLPYLRRQLALLQPKVIVCLGATAVKGLLDTKTGITKLRGNWMTFENIDVMPTFHPAYLLRNPPGKKDVWADMKAVLAHLGKEPPPREK